MMFFEGQACSNSENLDSLASGFFDLASPEIGGIDVAYCA